MHFSQRVAYMLSGLTGRLSQHAVCPACGHCGGTVCDRKWFHILIECPACMLLYRFPAEVTGGDVCVLQCWIFGATGDRTAR